MAVTIVRKFALGTQPTVERELTSEEEAAIVETFLERDAPPHRSEIAHAVRQHVYDGRLWLACDCNPDFAPLYFQLHHGHYVLHFGREGRPQHSDECQFGEKQRARQQERRQARHMRWNGLSHEEPEGSIWNVHSQVEDSPRASAKPSSSAAPAGALRRIPKMGRLLFQLLEEAGLNRVDDAYRRFEEDKVILLAARKFPLANGHPVSEFLTPNTFGLYPLCQKLRDAESKHSKFHWPRPSCPQGFMVLPTLEIESSDEGGDTLVLREKKAPGTSSGSHLTSNHPQAEHKRLSLTGKVRIIGPCRRGPFLTLVSVGRAKGDWKYQPWLACAVPVASPWTLLPVESGFEREVAKLLLKLVTPGWSQGRSIPPKLKGLELTKPLLDDPRWSMRPDFIVRDKATSRRLFIEVLGYEDDSYRDDKIAFAEKMIKQGERVILFDAIEAEIQRQWNVRLLELEKQISSFFGTTTS